MAMDVTERADPPSGSIMKMARVRVVEGPDAELTGELCSDEPVSIGTAADNDVTLSDPTVSRYHLELTRTDDGIHLRDLGSLNGTWMGSVRTRDADLPIGSRIRAGDTLLEIEGMDSVPEAAGAARPTVPSLIGCSRAMQRVTAAVLRLANSEVSVLIQGETGTGKEVVARALHELSERCDQPFVVVDCGSMPSTLIASELFGHERGAFTGADRQHVGAFERAHRGTLFLDEIGELPLGMQPSLLGALERRCFRRVGGKQEIKVDVRVLAATHRDLRAAVNTNAFRADLYYRIAVARIYNPPLRDRPEDIPLLVEHFAREVTGSLDHAQIGPESMKALQTHPWSGNVRELRNVVESALTLGEVQLDDGSPPQEAPDSRQPIVPYKEARTRSIATFEHSYLSALIAQCEGNASEAARRARMDRPYLLSLLRKHGLR